MSKYTFSVILSVSITQCLMCVSSVSTVNIIVQQEKNVTISCNINSTSLIAWYRLSSEKVSLLISATRGNIQKSIFFIDHNEDESHFQLKADSISESVSLEIIRFGEPDVGLYYCAARIGGKGMHFGSAVRLTFTDAKQEDFSHTPDNAGCRTRLICAYTACGLCGIICACVLCYSQGTSAVLCMNCLEKNSNLKTAEVEYASLKFVRQSRAASVEVAYATAANHTS